MAVAMFVRFTGISLQQYDRLMASFELDASPAVGEVLHVAAETRDGVDVCEVWQTRKTAESFVRDQLEPRLTELSLQPDVEFSIMPLHNLFAPDIDTIERIGAVSLPAVAAGAILR